MLLSINLQLILLSLVFDDITAQFSLAILTIVAAEAAIGLALVVIFYRLRNTFLWSYNL